MPRISCPPSYRRHKARNCAVVTISGQNHYLGAYGSPESHEKYARLIAEWQANGQRLPPAQGRRLDPAVGAGGRELRVSEVILAFVEHAQKHYRHADGTPTGELDNYRDALRPLRRL